MIEMLKNEDIINQVGGRFKLSSVIQKRWRELMMGARPMIEPAGMTPIEIVVKELMEGKLNFERRPGADSGSK